MSVFEMKNSLAFVFVLAKLAVSFGELQFVHLFCSVTICYSLVSLERFSEVPILTVTIRRLKFLISRSSKSMRSTFTHRAEVCRALII